MKSSLFDYQLPEELIAFYPPEKRDGGRMLVVDPHLKSVNHSQIRDLPDALVDNSLIIANDSKVFPARMFGVKKTGGKVETLLVRLVESTDSNCKWTALCKSNRPIKIGDAFNLQDAVCTVENEGLRGEKLLSVNMSAQEFNELVHEQGNIPLPPYIKRGAEDSDADRYQTVFADEEGSVAAPTAGLHLTDELISTIKKRGHDLKFVTLHVGPGTFRPINVDKITDHKMDVEYFTISKEVATAINLAKKEGRTIIAVGTTVVRTLEACAAMNDGEIVEGSYSTDIFIYPPYEFKVIDGLLTNFHLPKSTLLCLVSALGGREFIMDAYRQAVESEYRFYSYGDAMLVTNNEKKL